MPLYTDAKALCWLLDSLDYAIGSASVDSARRTYSCYSLMVSTIYLNFVCTDNIMKDRTRHDSDSVAWLVSRIWLLMSKSFLRFLRDVLDKAASKRYVKQLLATTNTEDRDIMC